MVILSRGAETIALCTAGCRAGRHFGSSGDQKMKAGAARWALNGDTVVILVWQQLLYETSIQLDKVFSGSVVVAA